jgi:hypothetical protein
MRHLRALAYARVLDLHECACLRVRLEDRAGAKVTERADRDTRADLCVDGDHVGSDRRARANARLPAQHGEGLDDRVRLQLDRRLDPGGRRVDDGDTGEHVRLVDPVPQCRRHRGELHPRVHALGLGGIVRLVGRDPLARVDQETHGVREVQLALRVRRLEPFERRPQGVASKDIDGRVDFVDRKLLRVCIRGLDDPADRTVLAADDPAVAPRVLAAEGQDGRRGAFPPVRLEQPLQRLRP